MKPALALALLGAAGCGRAPAQAPGHSPAPASAAAEPAPLALESWERGIALRSLEDEGMDMYLWFYEWNLLGAFGPGDSSPGAYHEGRVSVAPDGRSARVELPYAALACAVDADGVALELTVTNPLDRPFGELASIVPCFNPGPEERRTHALAHHFATYYAGATGLERAPEREMHFNAAYRERLEQLSPALEFAFSSKWPTSAHDAHGGLLLRESRDGRFVTGIAWEDFLGAQAHNPWQCLHLAVRVGPLAPGASRTIRGRIWHFAGGREELYQRWLSARAAW
jgi:hypothetical protein